MFHHKLLHYKKMTQMLDFVVSISAGSIHNNFSRLNETNKNIASCTFVAPIYPIMSLKDCYFSYTDICLHTLSFRPQKIVVPRHFLLKCLSQATIVSSYPYMCDGCQICLCFHYYQIGF